MALSTGVDPNLRRRSPTYWINLTKGRHMVTASQRGMNARSALESAVIFYDHRAPSGANTAQAKDVFALATIIADWLDNRTKEKA